MPAAFKTVKKTVQYDVAGATRIDVTVNIGDAQPGSAKLLWGKLIDVHNDEPIEISKDGDPLTGERLRINAVIQDKNPQTDWTSLAVVLEGGSKPDKPEFKELADEEDQLVIYMITVNLT